MASSHFIIEAVASARLEGEPEPRRAALFVEVEGSAPIKSQTELLRAIRAIAREEIERAVGTRTLGEFTIVEAKGFDKEGEPLADASWPGTYVWRVAMHHRAAA